MLIGRRLNDYQTNQQRSLRSLGQVLTGASGIFAGKHLPVIGVILQE
jgi:hypothetical protein